MSTTTNLGLFKHDNPATNTNAFDVKGALNDNWDKIDENAGDVEQTLQRQNTTISNMNTSLNAEITNRQTAVADLQTQLNSVASGSPAGVYSTVSALTTADPDHSKIYVVTADGHWYYYGNSQWNDGGVYQAAEDSETVEGLEEGVTELQSKWNINSNLLDYKIEVVKKLSTDADNTITCTIDTNGVLTINGTCPAEVFLMLTNDEKDRFPEQKYVILADNLDFSGMSRVYQSFAFFRYGHNQFNTYRYNYLNDNSISAVNKRIELTLDHDRDDSGNFTYTKDEIRFGLSLSAGTYTNVKLRIWVVKYGEDEDFSEFGLGELKKYTTTKTLKLKSDHNLRFAVATDIHWDHDDSTDTGLNGYEKTQILVDSINAENHKKPIDFLLITGDVNHADPYENIEEFKNKFLWQFEMPVVLFPGNHDGLLTQDWLDSTGYNRRTSLETEDFYFIFEDTFGDNLGKTWLSHWSAYYSSGNDEAYIPCKSTDTGALLVGTDITLENVSPTMRGWNYIPKNGDYVKLAKAKDCDMYKAPSLDYIKQEVQKAGDKYIILITHQIMQTADGDEEGVKDYLNSLDNFLFYLEGHAHVYYDYHNTTYNYWVLNSGHFFVPAGGWSNVASDNYRGFRIIEIDDNKLKTFKVQPTQNVGTQYEHQYNIVDKEDLFIIEKNGRADIDLLKLSKDKEYSNKLSNLESRIANIESTNNN